MIQQDNLYAVVVWYNPTEEQAHSLLSYLWAVRHIIIVDNSQKNNNSLLSDIPKENYTYIPLGDNLGIATALNRGCRAAIDAGAEWILTMDQDSVWDKEQLLYYIDTANKYPNIKRVGLFSPRQDYTGHIRHYPTDYEEKIAVMTSGCLLSTEGFRATNGFRDEFFIDEVDNEYCMHIHRLGMQVVIVNNALLVHQLGEKRMVRFMGLWRKEYIDHAPFRYYYIVRNNLQLSKLYPEYKTFNKKRLIKTIKRIVLYDRIHKCESLRMCLRGWRDFRNGVFGRLDL